MRTHARGVIDPFKYTSEIAYALNTGSSELAQGGQACTTGYGRNMCSLAMAHSQITRSTNILNVQMHDNGTK
eukprot:55794-Eustigmatos_ZCMA.PRE.1